MYPFNTFDGITDNELQRTHIEQKVETTHVLLITEGIAR